MKDEMKDKLLKLEGLAVAAKAQRMEQISAAGNVCFGLCADGRVWVCVYEPVVDEWVWHEIRHTPGVMK